MSIVFKPAGSVLSAQGPLGAQASAALVVSRGAGGMRVYVYVDGLNVYYRALQSSRNKWLDLNQLAVRLLNPDDTVEKIKYFTTRVGARPNDPDAPRRQQLYLNALDTLPNIEMHFGSFLSKTKSRPLASDPTRFVTVLDTEEKGSDVNLASHLIHDGWRDVYDLALVMSQDSDLVEPMRSLLFSRDMAVSADNRDHRVCGVSLEQA